MQATFASEAFPRVLVAVPAVTPYVDALLAGITHADNLLRPGQDAHEFALSGSQRHLLANADVIIIADDGMSALLSKLLVAEVKRGATVITLTALPGADPLPYEDHNPWLDAVRAKLAPPKEKTDQGDKEKADHDEAEHPTGQLKTDPHLWLDPLRMAAIATPLADGIAARAPAHRLQLEANATALSAHLRDEVDPALRAILSKPVAEHLSAKPYIPFITYHAAYQYFMKRYGLQNPGEITQRPEDYFGAGLMHDIIASADHASIHCILSETASPLVQRIAAASGATIITLSPEAPVAPSEIAGAPWVRNDYDRLLQKTAESFSGCL